MHRWVFLCGRWCCQRCLAITYTDEGNNKREHKKCKGYAPTISAIIQEPRGHKLVALHTLDGGEPWILCITCGAFATSRPEKLGCECEPPTASGQETLARVKRGRHPWWRRTAHHGCCARTFCRSPRSIFPFLRTTTPLCGRRTVQRSRTHSEIYLTWYILVRRTPFKAATQLHVAEYI